MKTFFLFFLFLALSCNLNDRVPSGTPTDTSLDDTGVIDLNDVAECSCFEEDETCKTKGFASGTLKCDEGCQMDTSDCVPLHCGNGQLDVDEVCESLAFQQNRNCVTEGYEGGNLKCSSSCKLDTSECYKCGDGIRNGEETCDGQDFDGLTCAQEMKTAKYIGTLKCSSDCSSVDSSDCHVGYKDVSSGYKHSCYLRVDGKIICRGWNESGQLGNTNSDESAHKQCVAGGLFSCSLEESGNVKCWGKMERFGTLEFPNPSGVFQHIAGRGGHACGILVDGSIRCWGLKYDTPIPRGNDFVEIAVGGYHACALHKSGQAECWQNNAQIEKHFGRVDQIRTTVPKNQTFKLIDAGSHRTCGITLENALVCWGRDADIINKNLSGKYIDVSSGGGFDCAIAPDYSVICQSVEDPKLRKTLDWKLRRIASGESHICGIDLNDEIQCDPIKIVVSNGGQVQKISLLP